MYLKSNWLGKIIELKIIKMEKLKKIIAVTLSSFLAKKWEDDQVKNPKSGFLAYKEQTQQGNIAHFIVLI